MYSPVLHEEAVEYRCNTGQGAWSNVVCLLSEVSFSEYEQEVCSLKEVFMRGREYYIDKGCGYFGSFITRNPEFGEGFRKFAKVLNRGGVAFEDIAKHEVLRLAYEWVVSDGQDA